MKIEIRICPGTYWYVILGSNGQVKLTSEIYASPSNARRAARRDGKRFKLPVTERK